MESGPAVLTRRPAGRAAGAAAWTLSRGVFPDDGCGSAGHPPAERDGCAWEEKLAGVGEREAGADRLTEVTAAPDRRSGVEPGECAFAGIAASAAGGGSLERMLDGMAGAVVEAAQLDACAIILVEDAPPTDGGCAGLPAADRYPRGYAAAGQAGRRRPLTRAFETRGPVVAGEVGEGPSLQGLVDQGWPEVVCLPLVVRGTPVGSLLVLCREGEKPGDVDGSALRAVADQAAMAVEVARVRPKTSEAAVIRERHGLARELHDSVTQLLFATSLLARASHLKLARIGGAGEKELREMLADLENSSTSALAQMRALLVELPPRHAPTGPDKEACHD